MNILKISVIAALFNMLLFSGSVLAQGVVCSQGSDDVTKLRCDYSQFSSEAVKVTATASGGQALQVLSNKPYPADGQSTAILYLVDTSNPHRQPIVKKNGELIQSLVSKASAYHKNGLAVFDSNFRLVVPVGSASDALHQGIVKLRAGGATTEFYRNIIEAVKVLAKEEASRKVLVVFSDGLAEDEAYSHEDVIAAAKKANVMIVGLGYAASALKATALQRLRRLADETSGLYQAADENLSFPAGFSDTLYHHIDLGGETMIDLTPLSGANDVVIRFMKGDQLVSKLSQHVLLPVKANPKRTLYMIAVAVILLILIVIFIARRKRLMVERKKALEDAIPTVLAQIEVLGGDGEWVDMIKPVWRIGRSDGNDLQLSDVSISGFHAEIHQNRESDFTITDLDSTNGVLVNGEEKHSQLLQDGDIIELGDIRLRFHCDGDIEDSEETEIYGSES